MVEMLKGDGKAIFTVFVGAIIAIVFLASIGDAVFDQSNTFTLANATVTAPATNASVAIEGRELIGTPTVVNDTNSSQQDLQDVGVFIDERVINGVKTVALTVNQTGDAFGGVAVNLSYTFGPDGFLERSVDRSIVALIVLFGALGVLVFVVVVLIMTGSLGRLIRGK